MSVYEVIWILFWHYNYWLNLSTQAWAFGPCLCVYGTLFFLCMKWYGYYYFDIIIIDSICQHRQEPSALPVCAWCFVFPMYDSEVIGILIFWHYNHWLNLSTQTGAFSPCLCVYAALFFLCMKWYGYYYFDIIIIDSIFQQPLAPTCVWIVLCFSHICVISILHSMIQSVNTGRSLLCLPMCE
jgi:hypothetical protein